MLGDGGDQSFGLFGRHGRGLERASVTNRTIQVSAFTPGCPKQHREVGPGDWAEAVDVDRHMIEPVALELPLSGLTVQWRPTPPSWRLGSPAELTALRSRSTWLRRRGGGLVRR